MDPIRCTALKAASTLWTNKSANSIFNYLRHEPSRNAIVGVPGATVSFDHCQTRGFWPINQKQHASALQESFLSRSQIFSDELDPRVVH